MTTRTTVLACLLACAPVLTAGAQPGRIRTVEVSGNVYMLMGRGGNIGLSVGDDGAFLIDDQFAPETGKIQAAIAKVSDKPVKFLVNTHWHGDHTGGNENFGKAGALIFAHENVRKRMSVEQFMKVFDRRVPPAPAAALPVVTFTDAVTFHWNGDEVHVFHVENAHTDGDAMIHFRKANALHMGDVYFNGLYPFIDVGSGGGIDGVIAAVDRALKLTDAKTRIIPGHGVLSGREELRGYRRMLADVRGRVAELVAAGRSADEVVEAAPTAAYDEKWGRGFMKPEVWTRLVYRSLTKK